MVRSRVLALLPMPLAFLLMAGASPVPLGGSQPLVMTVN